MFMSMAMCVFFFLAVCAQLFHWPAFPPHMTITAPKGHTHTFSYTHMIRKTGNTLHLYFILIQLPFSASVLHVWKTYKPVHMNLPGHSWFLSHSVTCSLLLFISTLADTVCSRSPAAALEWGCVLLIALSLLLLLRLSVPGPLSILPPFSLVVLAAVMLPRFGTVAQAQPGGHVPHSMWIHTWGEKQVQRKCKFYADIQYLQ